MGTPVMEPSNKEASKILLAASPESSRVGSSVVFEVRVESEIGTPIGTVTLSDGSKLLGKAPLSSSGAATFSSTTLERGVHDIVASYTPDNEISGNEGNDLVCRQRYEVKSSWNIQYMLACIQSFLAVLALLFANGWWTTYQSALEITLTANQDKEWDGGEYLIRGEIKIKNVGLKSANLNMENGALFIAPVQSIPEGVDAQARENQNGKIRLGKSKKIWLSRPCVDDLTRPNIEYEDQFRPGATDVFHFMLKVQQPGTYAILFSPAPNPEEKGTVPGVSNPRWEPPTIFVDVTDEGLTADQILKSRSASPVLNMDSHSDCPDYQVTKK